MKQIKYVHEPTDLQCGQAVLAMLTDNSPEKICEILGNTKETDLKEMKKILDMFDIKYSSERKSAEKKSDLPEICVLSLETPRCWHWSLYAYGTFYDPEHGVLDDFPIANRKFFWEVFLKSKNNE